MAKDPAFLFYSSDFLTGTMTMTHDQVGKYIRLLCLQHQKFILTKRDMLYICGTYDEDIFSKFTETPEGFYNERLRVEDSKRKNFCESRKLSRTSHVRSTYVQRTENENENENVIKDKKGKGVGKENKPRTFVAPAIEEVRVYCLERARGVDAQKWHDFYLSKDWMIGKNKMKDWKAAVRTWEHNQAPVTIDSTLEAKFDRIMKLKEE